MRGPLGSALWAAAALLAWDARAVAERIDGGFCQEQVIVFNSLRHGDFDYCRLHLRYRPGTAGCLRILAPTCNVVVPGGKRPVVKSGLDGFAERIICPPGPPPPSCPAGFLAGAIPFR